MIHLDKTCEGKIAVLRNQEQHIIHLRYGQPVINDNIYTDIGEPQNKKLYYWLDVVEILDRPDNLLELKRRV